MKDALNSEFLFALLENSSEGAIACDTQQRLIFANRRARELGWAEKIRYFQADGKTELQPDQVPLARALKGETLKDEIIILSVEGSSPFPVIVKANPIFDRSHRPLGAAAFFRDITQDLRLSNRFLTIYDEAPISIQILSPDGYTLMVNKAWKRLWNLPQEFIDTFIMKEYNILTDPLLEKRGVLPLIHRAFEGETVQVPKILYDPAEVGFAGTPRWTEGYMYPLKDHLGGLTEVVLIHVDVTQKHREEVAQNFLTQISTRLISTLEFDPLLEKLVDAVLEHFSDACVVDLVQDDEIHRALSRHRDPRFKEDFERSFQKYPPRMTSKHASAQVINSGKPLLIRELDSIGPYSENEEHEELIRRVGVKSAIVVPLESRGQIIGAMSFASTGAQRFDELDLKTALNLAQKASFAIENARLYASVKLALTQRDEFISIASHELKTPLTSLKLLMQMGQRQLNRVPQKVVDTSVVHQLTDTANKQLDRLTRLVEDMLDISRIATGRLKINAQRTDLTRLVEETTERFRGQLQVPVEIRSRISQGITLSCDWFRLEQVLSNLLTNALRYGQGRPIEVALWREGKSVFMSVSDAGPGIAPHDLHRIFDRYERAVSASDVSGLGLGLYISKQIVASHGGEITVESQVGQGATFKVELIDL